MALPLIPIIMAVASLGSGIVQGISSLKNSREEENAIRQQANEQMTERAKQAKKLMQQQKTSFLKSGVYFDSGTPLEVINETYDTMEKDVKQMAKDTDTKIQNLYRQGKTAFFNSVVEGIGNSALSYFMGGGNGLFSNLTSEITSKASNVGNSISNWYNSARGWTKGSFGSLPTKNGLPSGNTTKFV